MSTMLWLVTRLILLNPVESVCRDPLPQQQEEEQEADWSRAVDTEDDFEDDFDYETDIVDSDEGGHGEDTVVMGHPPHGDEVGDEDDIVVAIPARGAAAAATAPSSVSANTDMPATKER